ncbi:response regulator, partial [Myxococcota bacterium]|nr:response regulator [Myxococcota bacterium]
VFARLLKASERGTRHVLLIEDDIQTRESVVEALSSHNIVVSETGLGEEALLSLQREPFHCIILDLSLPDISGLEFLKKAETKGIALPPVIIYTARDLTHEQELELKEYAETIVLKDVRSKERLLDEVSLFLHSMASDFSDKTSKIIQKLHQTDELLRGKKVLVADDDMRTLFALSHLLAERGMSAIKAENGEEAIRKLKENPDIDIVLMDIMMPVVDGYEAIHRIRAHREFAQLPIIALTAKAMREDREKCIEAGANDYMAKPVDQERLISLMRVWLYR